MFAGGLSSSLVAETAGECVWCWAPCSLLSLLCAGDGRAALQAGLLSSWVKAHLIQEVLGREWRGLLGTGGLPPSLEGVSSWAYVLGKEAVSVKLYSSCHSNADARLAGCWGA